MASTSETGHAKNVANFEDLLSFCTSYGAAYNPTKPGITLTALNAKRTEAVNGLAALTSALPVLANAVNAREIMFEPLKKRVTRVLNAVAASDVPPQVIADVKTITRKLQGQRATPKKDAVPDDPATPGNEAVKSNSTSQLSYDNLTESLSKLIGMLSAQPQYKPNETDLTVTALTDWYNNITAANTAVINAGTMVSNARIARNNIMYHPKTGLMATAAYVKTYIKSIFGASAPQFKQVSKIKFKRPRL